MWMRTSIASPSGHPADLFATACGRTSVRRPWPLVFVILLFVLFLVFRESWCSLLFNRSAHSATCLGSMPSCLVNSFVMLGVRAVRWLRTLSSQLRNSSPTKPEDLFAKLPGCSEIWGWRCDSSEIWMFATIPPKFDFWWWLLRNLRLALRLIRNLRLALRLMRNLKCE